MSTGKNQTVQFFLGEHGKNDNDGIVFGKPGLGGTLKELGKQARIMSSKQLMEYCISRKQRTQARKSKKEQDLQIWEYFFMDPPRYPTMVTRLKQDAIHTHLCWESEKQNNSHGLNPVKI